MWRCPGDRVCDPRGPRIEPPVMILGAEYDGFPIHDGWAPYYRFLLAFHQSCLPVCRSAAARWRSTQGVPARLGRNLFASGRAFAAEEPGVARFAKISERGLRIATWKAGSQPGPDPGNCAATRQIRIVSDKQLVVWLAGQVGQPVWTGLRVNPELPAVAPVHGEIVTDGKLNHYRILYL